MPHTSQLCLAVPILLLLGCDQKPAAATPSAARESMPAGSTAAAPAPQPSAPSVTVAGVAFPVPDGWKQVPPANPMRAAELRVPDPSGDPGKECTVAFSTAGGDIQTNITRWAGQVRDASGQPAKPEVQTKTIGNRRTTIAHLTGSYVGMNEPARDNWTLRGAIVESSGGLVFVKMTGPAEAMAASAPAFDAMIAGMK